MNNQPDFSAFHKALSAAQDYLSGAEAALKKRLAHQSLDAEQRAAHGFAWAATSLAAMKALLDWAEGNGAENPVNADVLQLGFAEMLAQLCGGLPMGQNEFFRPTDLNLGPAARQLADDCAWILNQDHAPIRARLAKNLAQGQWPSEAMQDSDLDAIREQYRRFTDAAILPHAHGWHLANALIPDETITAMAELGTFGVCIAEEYGGLGLGKLVMCIITEELSRGWIGAGSLGTRSEIAGELISLGGTEEQKSTYLPRIASGEILPTAVFTEPDVGSDLGSLQSRARRSESGEWQISGAKNWITHAARSDLMTLLARSKMDEKSYAGLSMFLIPKARGTENNPFPDTGLSGSEIEVLGYRGMREYALQFDEFGAPADALLGGEEGRGFKQLMQTFEGARIQTAARAVGVARRALELGLDYAQSRKQFGQSILNFPRVSDKIAMSLVDYIMARELSYLAARAKDSGKRCDIEAGMAKLFGARAAWANADAAVQIHGGNGYATEYEISRILCDARILNIFEGAAEIQAQVIAKGLLSQRN